MIYFLVSVVATISLIIPAMALQALAEQLEEARKEARRLTAALLADQKNPVTAAVYQHAIPGGDQRSDHQRLEDAPQSQSRSPKPLGL